MKILTALLISSASASIFQSKQEANQQLHYRARRDNNGIFEELQAANLQRECIDEVCSYDEILEAYDGNEAKAADFWNAATKMCEAEGSCNRAGTATCVNKWRKRECRCKSGWQNLLSDDCSEDVDECANEGWCQNGGECTNTVGSFICLCPQGWEGANCELDINECEAATNPCLNGGSCTNTEGSYTCSCPDNWTGLNCEIDVDECAADVDPCQNDSPCINTDGSYQCLCNNGWGGQNCDTDYDECGNGMCPEGTICQTLEMNQFTCVCPERGCNNLDEEKYNELLASVTVEEVIPEIFDEDADDSYENNVVSEENADVDNSYDDSFVEVDQNSEDGDLFDEDAEEQFVAEVSEDYTAGSIDDDDSEDYQQEEVLDEVDNRPYDEDAFAEDDDSEVLESEVVDNNLDSLDSEGDEFYDNYA